MSSSAQKWPGREEPQAEGSCGHQQGCSPEQAAVSSLASCIRLNVKPATRGSRGPRSPIHLSAPSKLPPWGARPTSPCHCQQARGPPCGWQQLVPSPGDITACLQWPISFLCPGTRAPWPRLQNQTTCLSEKNPGSHQKQSKIDLQGTPLPVLGVPWPLTETQSLPETRELVSVWVT